jgi:hypothetical protein
VTIRCRLQDLRRFVPSGRTGCGNGFHEAPERFSWLLRIDSHDKDFDNLMGEVRASPQGRVLRLAARGEEDPPLV